MADSNKQAEGTSTLRASLQAGIQQVRTKWQQLGGEIRSHDGDMLEELEDYFNSSMFRLSGGISVLQTVPAVSANSAADLAQMKNEIAMCAAIGKLLLDTCRKTVSGESVHNKGS
jgi:hypothetical protein